VSDANEAGAQKHQLKFQQYSRTRQGTMRFLFLTKTWAEQ
jgi:hypothetical protein